MNTDEPHNQMPPADIAPMKHTDFQQPRDLLADIARMLRQQEARLDRLQADILRIDDRIASVAGYVTTMVLAVTVAVILVTLIIVAAILMG